MKKLFIFIGAILLVLVLSGAASATGPATPGYTPAVKTEDSAIDGHKMVYEKKSTSTNKDIYFTDLSTGSSKAVSTSTYNEENPDISGNIVVWQKYDSSNHWQIYMKDISKTNAASLVHAVAGKDQISPSISGKYIVWQQYNTGASADSGWMGDYDIVGYSLATGKYYGRITWNGHETQWNPDISGNTVVYQQYDNLGSTASPNFVWQVYKTTFGTDSQGSKIDSSINNQVTPVVSRTGRAAWAQWEGITWKYDIAWVANVWLPTLRHYEYTTNFDIEPAIYGNMLVWREQYSSDSSDYDICMKNLGTTGIALTKTKVSTSAYNQYAPSVGGDNTGIFVAYTDTRDAYSRVYWRNMAKPPTATAGSPARNAVNIPRDQPITTTFNEQIKAGTMHIELYEAATKTQVAIGKSISGSVLTITHALLKKATKYTITLFEGSITDAIGNKIAIYSRSFTTGNT